MSVAAHDAFAGPAGAAVVPVRPSWLLGVFLDALLGVSAYIASYWLRFDSERLAAFLPGAWSTVPLVVGAQILALGALQAYAPRPRASWLSRVVAGIVLGTGASALLLGVAVGFQGMSRMAFAADALLLSIAAIGWRGCLGAARESARTDPGARVGRRARGPRRRDDARHRPREPLQLSELVEGARPQRSQTEVPRVRSSAFSGRWPTRC